MTSLFSLALLVLPSLIAPVWAVDNDTNSELNQQLELAPTQLDYLNLLPNDSDWIFDFTKSPKYTFAPGGVINANAATFPAATGYDMTLALLNLGPCAMLPPHYHPRAPNFAVVVKGTVETWMIQENGARTVRTVLTPGMMTIFPEGAIHGMRNLGCDDAQLVSALSSSDTGTTNLANNLFSFPDDILSVLFGVDSSVLDAMRAVIPPVGTGSNYGNDTCLATCGVGGSDNSTTPTNSSSSASTTIAVADTPATGSAAAETEAYGYPIYGHGYGGEETTSAGAAPTSMKKGRRGMRMA